MKTRDYSRSWAVVLRVALIGLVINPAAWGDEPGAALGPAPGEGDTVYSRAEPEAVNPPLIPEPPHDVRKNRILSFLANNPDTAVAFQVELTAVGPAECYENDPAGDVGMTWWVSAPVCLDYNGVDVTASDPTCTGSDHSRPHLWHAQLRIEEQAPTIWPDGVIHIADCEVISVATYAMRATDNPTDPTFSSDSVIGTIHKPGGKCWADCVGAFDGTRWLPPDGVVGMDDIMAAVMCFTFDANRPHRTRAVLYYVDYCFVNFADIQHLIFGFKAEPYSFEKPSDCPP